MQASRLRAARSWALRCSRPWFSSSRFYSFDEFALGLAQAAKAQGSKEKIAELAAAERRVWVASGVAAAKDAGWLLLGMPGPAHCTPEINVGRESILAAVSDAFNVSEPGLASLVEQTADLGVAAMKAHEVWHTQNRSSDASSPTVSQVRSLLLALTRESGPGSVSRRQVLVRDALRSCQTGDGVCFLVRMLEGPSKLRIGAGERAVVAAIARAATAVSSLSVSGAALAQPMVDEGPSDSAAQALFALAPSVDELIDRLSHHNMNAESALAAAAPHVGLPIQSMLGVAAASPEDAARRAMKWRDLSPLAQDFQVTAQWKLDGERAQVHFDRTASVSRVFSRNGEDSSAKFPGLVTQVLAAARNPSTLQSFILEGEAVVVSVTGKVVQDSPFGGGVTLRPFREVSSLRRKARAADAAPAPSDNNMQVRLVAFDCLELNGMSLLRLTLRERRRILYESFMPASGADGMILCPSADVDVVGDADDGSAVDSITVRLHDEAIRAASYGCEGIMLKPLDGSVSQYEPGTRSVAWTKLKVDAAGFSKADGTQVGGDTFDLVPVAAYVGTGKRASMFGSFVLACRAASDPSVFVPVASVGTGMTDEFLTTAAAIVHDHPQSVSTTPPMWVQVPAKWSGRRSPDVWFHDPELLGLWEVRSASVSLSPVYEAGRGAVSWLPAGRGLSLRFPRLLRVRDDKSSQQATTEGELSALAHPDRV